MQSQKDRTNLVRQSCRVEKINKLGKTMQSRRSRADSGEMQSRRY